jgi:aspartate 1-decarboxylase
MDISLLKSKIHRATVTGASLDYEGSLTIDPEWMQAVDLLPYEKILVANITNGERFETYAILGKPGQRQIELNGAAARCGQIGDRLVIMSFASMPVDQARTHQPRKILLDAQNTVIQRENTLEPT